MAYDQGLVDRVRESLIGEPGLPERKMFGAYCFFLDGNICTGVEGERLIARVPIGDFETLLAREGVEKFPNEERPMKAWLAIEPDNIAEDEDLQEWIRFGIQVARSYPPK